MIDTEHFDMIDYNSYEYLKYINDLISKRPKNYDKLQTVAELSAQKIINMYQLDKDHNKTLNYYLNYVISKYKYSDNEKTIIESGIIHFITKNHFDINKTDPLILSKF